MAEAAGNVGRLDDRIYDLDRRVGRLEGTMQQVLARLDSLNRLLVLVVASGIIGPIAAVLIGHALAG